MWQLGAIPVMRYLSFKAGNGDWKAAAPEWTHGLPEIAFGACFGLANYAINGSAIWGIIGFLLGFLGMQTGHGNVYRMRGIDGSYADDPELLEKILRPVYVFFRGDIHQPRYSWFIMGAKGSIIALGIFPYGLPLAILWPFSYDYSLAKTGDTKMAELLSGTLAGSLVCWALWGM